MCKWILEKCVVEELARVTSVSEIRGVDGDLWICNVLNGVQ